MYHLRTCLDDATTKYQKNDIENFKFEPAFDC